MNAVKLLTIFALILAGSCPAYAQRVRGDFEESEFDRASKKKREAAFTQWMPGAMAGDVLGRAELDGKVLLILERNSNGESRAVFDIPDTRRFDVEYSSSISERQMLEKHALMEKGAFQILFLQKNPSGRSYCVIWIKKGGYAEAVAKLANLGVTPAKIELKASSSPTITGPVTSGHRRWTDKAGRVVEASLAEIDADKIILIKKGGGRFPFLIAKLSTEDQQFLKKLIANHKKPKVEMSGNSEGSGEFTDWYSYSEWELKYDDERAKGRYAIYVESNNKRELRGIFDKRPRGLGWFNAWLDSEADVKRKNASYESKGLRILSVSFERRTDRYNAVWVSNRVLDKAREQLAASGITPADIGKKIQVSKVKKK